MIDPLPIRLSRCERYRLLNIGPVSIRTILPDGKHRQVDLVIAGVNSSLVGAATLPRHPISKLI